MYNVKSEDKLQPRNDIMTLFLNDGYTTSKRGSVLVKKMPDIGPLAYLHRFYRGLDEYELSNMESVFGMVLPREYYNFLNSCNGASLYSRSLLFYGFIEGNQIDRQDFERPISIVIKNQSYVDPGFRIGSKSILIGAIAGYNVIFNVCLYESGDCYIHSGNKIIWKFPNISEFVSKYRAVFDYFFNNDYHKLSDAIFIDMNIKPFHD